MPDEKPEVKPVKLICGVMYVPRTELDAVDEAMVSIFGSIDLRSEPFEFSFTDYYEKEMGSNLKKYFCSFEGLISPDTLSSIKNKTISIEGKFASDGKRTVNLDPGYIEESKLVLASTKNFSHRIYLGDKIWGEVTLRYENARFVTHPWTYPDYATPLSIDFFKTIREKYRKQIILS
jgi:hypothetical protein